MSKKPIKTVDGRPVIAQTMALRRTGDGLSTALEIDPLDVHIGDDIVLVVRGRVAGKNLVEADPKDPEDDDLNEVIVVYGGTITVATDEGALTEMLDAQAKKNEVLAERKKGVQRIPGTDPTSDNLDDDEGGED